MVGCDVMFYPEVIPSHAIYKEPILIDIFSETRNCDNLTIVGAQWRKDTASLVETAILRNVFIILIDINRNECKKWKSLNYPLLNIINVDADNIDFKRLLSRFHSPFLYDNLSGGNKRIGYWKEWLAEIPHLTLIAFVSRFRATHRNVYDYCEVIERFPLGNEENWLYVLGNGLPNPDCKPKPKTEHYKGRYCPFCGEIRWGQISVSKNGALRCCSCKTKWSKEDEEHGRIYPTIYGNRHWINAYCHAIVLSDNSSILMK